MKTLYLLIFAVLLSGCNAASKSSDNGGNVSFVETLVTSGQSPNVLMGGVDDAAKENGKMSVRIPLLRLSGDLVQIARNNGRDTRGNTSGTSVTFENGLIVATRGLGDDLYGADISKIDFNTPYTRVVEYLDGNDSISRQKYACTPEFITDDILKFASGEVKARVIEDRCESNSLIFVNRYWLDQDDTVILSQQWISEDIGYLVTLLNR